MNPIKWLEQHVRGFSELPEPDRLAIFHFALLWSLYESKTHGTRASAHSILAQVHEWKAQGKLTMQKFAVELEYFQNRYFQNEVPTQYFAGLNLRNNDNPGVVRAVLAGMNNDPVDSVAALLIVVYRLRNNLFHGVKWTYSIQGQLDNFTHANAALMSALEIAGEA